MFGSKKLNVEKYLNPRKKQRKHSRDQLRLFTKRLNLNNSSGKISTNWLNEPDLYN
jgi:hypothetical protein